MRAVFRKEVVDALRDRRSLMSALLYPILMPLMITVVFTAVAQMEGSERPVELPIVGQDRAPNLVAWLEERGVVVLDPPADPDAAVRDGDVDLVLVIDEDYGERFRSVEPAVVRIVHDSSRTASLSSIRRTRNLLRALQRRGGPAAPAGARRQPGRDAGGARRRPRPRDAGPDRGALLLHAADAAHPGSRSSGG